MEDISIDKIAYVVLRGQHQETIQVVGNKFANIYRTDSRLRLSAHELEIRSISKLQTHQSGRDACEYKLMKYTGKGVNSNKDASTTNGLGRSRGLWNSCGGDK